MEKYFNNIKAVDPTNCGCTECVTSEYVNKTHWLNNALPGDVLNLLSGDVRDNTDQYPEKLWVFNNYYEFSSTETQNFIQKLNLYVLNEGIKNLFPDRIENMCDIEI